MRPKQGDYPEYLAGYIEEITSDDILATLTHQLETSLTFLNEFAEPQTYYRYAAGKWSMKQILSHIIDCERVYTYRALRIARNDDTPMAGFDENAYVLNSRAEHRSWDNLIAEYKAVRLATIALLSSLNQKELAKSGTANEKKITANALFYMTAAHESHHLEVIKAKYM